MENKKVLCIQISTNLINADNKDSDIMSQYYNTLYKVKKPNGYYKGFEFWEAPKWQCMIAYNIKTDSYVCKSTNQTIEYINNTNYDYIAFSILDVNKDIIRKIINSDKLKDKHFIIGGYINFKQYTKTLKHNNYKHYKTIKDFIQTEFNKPFKYGFNYNNFKNMEVIPRLTLSKGCLNNCDFCTVQKHLTKISDKNIINECKNFKPLKFKLVYINDKTFGQCENYKLLPKLYKIIKNYNPYFEGFIIQTTTITLVKKLTHKFIKDAHINYIELGIETFNQDILTKYHKASNLSYSLKSFDYIREYNNKYQNKAYIIPNIIIGFKEENTHTYNKTLWYLKTNLDVISHFNIYNLAIYEGTELSKKIKYTESDKNELNVKKSFHKNPNVHLKFYKDIFTLGINHLNNNKPERYQIIKNELQLLNIL